MLQKFRQYAEVPANRRRGCDPSSTLLASRRIATRGSMLRVSKRVLAVLEQQRAHTEKVIPPSTVSVDELHPQGTQHLEEELNEAYVAASRKLADLKTAIVAVRGLERQVRPGLLDRPAVMALAISAPSTSWALDCVELTPVPRLAEIVTSVFNAAFSNPDNRDNKLKRRWGPDTITASKNRTKKSIVDTTN